MTRAIDLAGRRFGRLVALRPTAERQNGKVVWECHCDCGKVVNVVAGNLTSGVSRSCGCLSRDRAKERAANLAGLRFGRLTVMHKTEERRASNVVWECRCDCGKTVSATSVNLRRGHVKSCGCLPLDRAEENRIDLAGRRFGRLVAVKHLGSDKWLCQCDCGRVKEVSSESLRRGRTLSCGCLKPYLPKWEGTHGLSGTVQYEMLSAARMRAKREGLDFDLTLDDTVVPEACPILGIPLAKGDGRQHDASPSLDRIEPSRGYVKGNVVVVSLRANRIKGNASSEQLQKVADWMRSWGL